MSMFLKALLAFSLSVNLMGAAVVAHHWVTTPDEGCGARCPHDVGGTLLVAEEGRPVENIEAMRRSFHTYREGCQCAMRELRERLVTAMLADEIDPVLVEEILNAMGSRQVDLQRRLVEQILAERSALSEEDREVFDGRLRGRLLGASGCCPGRNTN